MASVDGIKFLPRTRGRRPESYAGREARRKLGKT